MVTKQLSILVALSLILGVACTTPRRTANYKDQVKTALEQADLKDVSVSDDAQKNTLTLSGTVHTDEAKNKAGEIAKANAGDRVIANEISVQPVGQESAAKDSASNLDDGIEKNYKAALIQKGLDKRHIRFEAKNGVLTLKGSVPNPKERREAQELAQATPNVAQVVNQIEVRR